MTRGPRSGLTLIELMLVLLLMGVIAGAGLGVLSSLDFGRRQAVGLVKNVVRSAQNTAMARRAPTAIVIDRAAGVLRPRFQRVVGTWHFEDELLTGAFGSRGALVGGGRIVEDGYLGKALSFVGEPAASHARFEVENRSAFDLTDGFSIECALVRDGESGFRAVNLGRAAGIDVLADGTLRGWFVPGLPRPDGTGVTRGSPVVAESEAGVVPPGRWVRVRVDYDRDVLRLSADGLTVAERPEEAMVSLPDAPMTLSEPGAPCPAAIDSLVVRALSVEGAAQLPEGVTFAAGVPAAVHFDAGGRLDRSRHAEPVRIALDYGDGTREVIQIGLYGTVEG